MVLFSRRITSKLVWLTKDDPMHHIGKLRKSSQEYGVLDLRVSDNMVNKPV